MTNWNKKVLQKRGYETSTEAQQPNDFYQIELPELKIPTVVNPETSILRGLERRKIKDEYNNAYNEYMQNNTMDKGFGDLDPDLGWVRHPSVLYDHYAREYAKNKTGYDFGDPVLDSWKNNQKAQLATGAIALSFPVISGISAGELGILPKLGLDLSFAYKILLSPEGIAKTARFVRQGKLGRAAFSGAGDLLDIGLTRLGLKSLGSIGRYAREVSNVAKFNRWNKAAGFRMDYPWQLRSNTIPNGNITLENVPALQGRPLHQRIFTSKGAFTGYDPDMYTEKPMQAIKDFKFGRQDAWNYLGSKRKQKLDAYNAALLKRIVESDVQLSSEPFLIERNPQLRSMTPMQKPTSIMQRIQDATWVGNNEDGLFLFHPKGVVQGETHIFKGLPASSDQMYLNTRTSLDDSAFHEYLHRGKVGDAKGLAGWFYQWKMKKLMKSLEDIDPQWREYAQIPQEAVNFIEIGRKAGITNTPYPGPGPAKIIIKHIIDNDTLKGGFLNSTKWETKPKRVWDALQGKYIGLLPIGLGTNLMLNNNENE